MAEQEKNKIKYICVFRLNLNSNVFVLNVYTNKMYELLPRCQMEYILVRFLLYVKQCNIVVNRLLQVRSIF